MGLGTHGVSLPGAVKRSSKRWTYRPTLGAIARFE